MPLHIIRQDITKMQVDAIVNPTNAEMIGYSGVDFAIHTAAGKEMDAECKRIAPLPLAHAKLTKGYALPARFVIHTHGPTWRGGSEGERDILRACYLECLTLAVRAGCESVAFPLISAGHEGFPKDEVLKFAVHSIAEFLLSHELCVYLCVFDKDSYTFSQKLFSDIRAFIDDGYAKERESFCELMTNARENAVCYARRRREEREMQSSLSSSAIGESLAEYMAHMDASFQEMLFDLIDMRGISDVECYKRANVDKRTFSKIKSNKNYRPSKQTAVAFAIALRLTLKETQSLLATAGFTLSESKVFDKIILYFILHRNYDVFAINEALFEFDQSLLGSV